MLMAGLMLPRAFAHPFGQQYFGLRTELRMVEQGPELVVVGEVPIAVVLAEFRQSFRGVVRPGPAEDEAYMQRKLDQLEEGLVLRVNGAAVQGSWVPLSDARNGRSAEGSFTYFLVFEPEQPWDVEGPRLELELETAAYPDVPLWFSAYAGVGAGGSTGWSVTENSARAAIGDAADDPDGVSSPDGWSQEPSMRSWRVELEHQDPAEPEAPRGGCWG